MAAYVVEVKGLDASIAEAKATPAKIVRAARLAVDAAAERARIAAAREIQRQVRFTATYLTGPEGRLQISGKATNSNLERIITGRQRPTSLAQFVTSQKKDGVTVQVKPGSRRFIPNAFLINLRSGKQLTDTVKNQGLAIRLKPGETIRNKKETIRIAKGLYLLYGPSVDQVFRQVADKLSVDTGVFMEDEFHRLLNVDALNA